VTGTGIELSNCFGFDAWDTESSSRTSGLSCTQTIAASAKHTEHSRPPSCTQSVLTLPRLLAFEFSWRFIGLSEPSTFSPVAVLNLPSAAALLCFFLNPPSWQPTVKHFLATSTLPAIFVLPEILANPGQSCTCAIRSVEPSGPV
jgi:hypothetical protein